MTPDQRAGKPSELRRKLRLHRLQELKLPDGKIVFAPWEFRNSIMGGGTQRKWEAT